MSWNIDENQERFMTRRSGRDPGVFPSTPPEEIMMKTHRMCLDRDVPRKPELLNEQELWDFERFELERSPNILRSNENQQEASIFPLRSEGLISNTNQSNRLQQHLYADEGTPSHHLAVQRDLAADIKALPNSPVVSADPFYQSQSSGTTGSGAWAEFIKQTRNPVQHLPGLGNSRWADDNADDALNKVEKERSDIEGGSKVSGIPSTVEEAVRLRENEARTQERRPSATLSNSPFMTREKVQAGDSLQTQPMRGETERRTRGDGQCLEPEPAITPTPSEPADHQRRSQAWVGKFIFKGNLNGATPDRFMDEHLQRPLEELGVRTEHQTFDLPQRAFLSSRELPQRPLGYGEGSGRDLGGNQGLVGANMSRVYKPEWDAWRSDSQLQYGRGYESPVANSGGLAVQRHRTTYTSQDARSGCN